MSLLHPYQKIAGARLLLPPVAFTTRRPRHDSETELIAPVIREDMQGHVSGALGKGETSLGSGLWPSVLEGYYTESGESSWLDVLHTGAVRGVDVVVSGDVVSFVTVGGGTTPSVWYREVQEGEETVRYYYAASTNRVREDQTYYFTCTIKRAPVNNPSAATTTTVEISQESYIHLHNVDGADVSVTGVRRDGKEIIVSAHYVAGEGGGQLPQEKVTGIVMFVDVDTGQVVQQYSNYHVIERVESVTNRDAVTPSHIRHTDACGGHGDGFTIEFGSTSTGANNSRSFGYQIPVLGFYTDGENYDIIRIDRDYSESSSASSNQRSFRSSLDCRSENEVDLSPTSDDRISETAGSWSASVDVSDTLTVTSDNLGTLYWAEVDRTGTQSGSIGRSWVEWRHIRLRHILYGHSRDGVTEATFQDSIGNQEQWTREGVPSTAGVGVSDQYYEAYSVATARIEYESHLHWLRRIRPEPRTLIVGDFDVGRDQPRIDNAVSFLNGDVIEGPNEVTGSLPFAPHFRRTDIPFKELRDMGEGDNYIAAHVAIIPRSALWPEWPDPPEPENDGD